MLKAKKIALALFALFLMGGSFLTTAWVAENYFFDKLIYKKLSTYGYIEDGGTSEPYFKDPFQGSRISDLRLVHQELPEKKVLGSSTDKYQIVIIGDSFTYGVGVRTDQRYTDVLESMLDQEKDVEIYNLALPGDGIVDYYTNYRLAKQYIDPDLFIIAMVENDFIINPYPKYPKQKEDLKLLSDLCGDSTYVTDWKKINLSDPGEVFLKSSYVSTSNPANLCFAKEVLSRIDMSRTLFFTMSPVYNDEEVLFSYEKDENDRQMSDFLRNQTMIRYLEIVEGSGGHAIRINPYLAFPIKEISVSVKEGHYSPIVNEYIAQKLANEIIMERKWNFKK